MELLVCHNLLYLFLVSSLVDFLTADVGLHFVQSPEPIVAPLKDEIVFECRLDVPAEQVRWKHNGTLLSFKENSTSKSQLIFKVSEESQVGDYQCIASYGASALASNPAKLSLARLTVNKSKTQQSQTRELIVTSGNNVVIKCDVPFSNPAPLVQFYKNNFTIQDAEILPSGSLLLRRVTSRDSGTYTCSVTNNYVSDKPVVLPAAYRLDVLTKQTSRQQPPKFLFTPSVRYTAESGSNTTLECVGVGDPVPRVTWRRQLSELPRDRSTVTTSGLQLFNIVQSDAGVYICEVNNGVNPALHHIIELVFHEAAKVVREPIDMLVEEGDNVKLECSVRGTPTPRVTWLLNAEPVYNDSHIVTNGSRVTITQVEKRHAGFYQCMAENELGSEFGCSMLRVSPKQVTAESNGHVISHVRTSSSRPHGKHHKKNGGGGRKKHRGSAVMIPPSKPNITRLSESSVMVRWQVPTNNGLPILFFKVQHKELDRQKNKGKSSGWMTNNEDIQPHLTSYEVMNLEPDRHYRFRIAAVYSNNDNKLGPNSVKFYLQKGPAKDPPQAPVLKYTTGAGPHAIHIVWDYHNNSKVHIEGFYVYYRSTLNAGDYMKATVEGENVRSYCITHLEPDTGYDIKLQSFTVNAASNFSEIVTQKTQRLSTVSPPPTETPSDDLENTNDEKSKTSNQLYITLVAALSGIALLLTLCFGIFLCNKQRQPHSETNDNDEQDKQQQQQQIPMESFSVNGHPVSRSNGHITKTNGYLPSKVNITSNPLADTDEDNNENVMEISFITRTTTTTTTTTNQNNNHRPTSHGNKIEVNHSVNQVCTSNEDSVYVHGTSSPVLPSCALESDTWRRCDVSRTVENYV